MGYAVGCTLIVEFPGHTHLLFYRSEKNNFIHLKQFMRYFQVKEIIYPSFFTKNGQSISFKLISHDLRDITLGRWQSKMLILSTKVDKKSLETVFECHLAIKNTVSSYF